MPKRKKDFQISNPTGDHKDKQMILRVDPETHAWIKTIAETAHMAQPKVVSFVLGEASKNQASELANKILKLNAESELKELNERKKQLEDQIKEKEDLLDS